MSRISSQATFYTYDIWRLVGVLDADGRKTVFEYDAFGNRTRETITNINDPLASQGEPKPYGDYVYEYGANSNRLNRVLYNGQPLETYTYDNAGRMVQRVHATAGTTTYAYDPRGLLTSVTAIPTTRSGCARPRP